MILAATMGRGIRCSRRASFSRPTTSFKQNVCSSAGRLSTSPHLRQILARSRTGHPGFDRVRSLHRLTVGRGQPHAAEPYCRDFKAAASKFALLNCLVSLVLLRWLCSAPSRHCRSSHTGGPTVSLLPRQRAWVGFDAGPDPSYDGKRPLSRKNMCEVTSTSGLDRWRSSAAMSSSISSRPMKPPFTSLSRTLLMKSRRIGRRSWPGG